MNIRDLDYFYQLSVLKSFTETAQHFQVSQPTITYAVKRLEKEFRCLLVEKTSANRVAHLTVQGRILANLAQDMLLRVEKADKAIQRANQQESRLGFPPIISEDVFSRLDAPEEELALLKSVTLVRGGSKELLDALLAGDLDMSLLGSLEPLSYPELVSRELYRREFYLVMSAEHPLAESRELSFEAVLQEKFILLDEHNVHLAAFHHLNSRCQHAAEIALKLDDLMFIGQMLRKNMGISLLTDTMMTNEFADLVKIPLAAADKIYFHVSYAYPQKHVLSEQLEPFVKALEQIEQ
ncbi:LysR substrate-binding domain-containing protein [Streptococcus panodentis]|uniref:LysR family transcriptional regulator n=1 Tax=Streptococcus panodentis TaxID=1581472 RepID=A0ABS5AXK1_9STRE|nr:MULTISPECIES: LysR family transcriptional regulator [Streptococcus]KXT81879.1 Malolactic regulator [Streptococcus sp. DD11]MBP2621295.1 LysR family transcriptional regulator [Streptococcus panodentis]